MSASTFIRHFLCVVTVWIPSDVWAEMCSPSDAERPLWGDLHIHTVFSMDAFVFGVRRTPDDAYRFARGDEYTLADGRTVGLDRPLDFAAVTDHAEYLAVTNRCTSSESRGAYCRALDTASRRGDMSAFFEFFLPAVANNEHICPNGGDVSADPRPCRAASRSAWEVIQRAANDAYVPCSFTTFVGFEWTASPNVLHWHRNVLFEGAAITTPIDALDHPTQEDLWRELDTRCVAAEGCRALAIPHNSNIGMGGTFRVDEDDAASLALRARFERLAEVFQHKGQSECFPGAVLSDDACDFEIMLPVPVTRRQAASPGDLTPEEFAATASGYLRGALGRGLAIEANTGVNPFRYGLIGSTDSHTASPGHVRESGWTGAFGNVDDTFDEQLRTPQYNPGGLVAVWSAENTRESVFAALDRREVYATSGPRIGLKFDRVVGAGACGAESKARHPMGSVVVLGDEPSFEVDVTMDVEPIERIDIVKLFYRGQSVKQRIVSTTSEGRSDWCFAWRDDDYEPGESALYYARVLERSSSRWNSRENMAETVQERAWSSPIWSRGTSRDE